MSTAIAAGPGVQAVAHAESRGRRTREATDRKIMRATMQIALQRGIAAVTIEEVARRSGVAKTTIYRRYANTGELLRGLKSLGLPDDAAMEDWEPTQGNLERLLAGVVERFRAGIGVKTVGMVLASDDEFFRHVVDEAVRPEEERCVGFFRRGVADGVFRPDVDARFLFGTAIGSMVACEALRGAVDDGWPARMAGLIWPAIAV